MSRFLSVFKKDLQSEWRNRQAIFALLLFVLNSVVTVLFASGGQQLSPELFSGIIWLLLVFSSSVGMAKSFVSEEERGTLLYLQIVSTAPSVFFGKLLYNVGLAVIMVIVSSFLCTIVFELSLVAEPLRFLLALVVGSYAVSVAMTMSAAMIARSQAKGALLPVLSFPLVLPVLFLGVDATSMGVAGTAWQYILPNLGIMLSYGIVLTIICWWLFPFLWND